jgi:hypothetical protein
MYIYHFPKIRRREKDTCFHCLDRFGNTEMNSYGDQDAIYVQKEFFFTGNSRTLLCIFIDFFT